MDEINNCNLSSKLTTLSACETGKPNFHEREGLFSFAHAFNYAVSESMLTGLWKEEGTSKCNFTGSFLRESHKRA